MKKNTCTYDKVHLDVADGKIELNGGRVRLQLMQHSFCLGGCYKEKNQTIDKNIFVQILTSYYNLTKY